MIPETTRETILDAMRRFDHELRNTPEWSNWEQKANYRYAINHEGRHYPVKQIISMATSITGRITQVATHLNVSTVKLNR